MRILYQYLARVRGLAVDHLELGINLDRQAAGQLRPEPFEAWVPEVRVIDDGSAQSYLGDNGDLPVGIIIRSTQQYTANRRCRTEPII